MIAIFILVFSLVVLGIVSWLAYAKYTSSKITPSPPCPIGPGPCPLGPTGHPGPTGQRGSTGIAPSKPQPPTPEPQPPTPEPGLNFKRKGFFLRMVDELVEEVILKPKASRTHSKKQGTTNA